MNTSALDEFVGTLPHDGCFSLWKGPVAGPPHVAHGVDELHYAASTMKLALVIAAYRKAESGHLDLDGPVTVHNDFRSQADGSSFSIDRTVDSDPEPWRRLGERVALRWLSHRAIVKSSNLATNLVLDEVGTAAVNETLVTLGAATSLVSRGIEDATAREAGMQNVVSAAGLAHSLQALSAGTALSHSGCREILAVLAAQQINDGIPVGLPVGVRVAHKSGWVDGVSHDAAIVWPAEAQGGDPFVLVVCTTSALGQQAGLDLIAAAASAAWADRRL